MAKKYPGNYIVTKVATTSPRRGDSRGAKLWELYSTGDTVADIESRWEAHRATLSPDEAKKAGAVRLHLDWDVAHGDIRVEAPEEASTQRQHEADNEGAAKPQTDDVLLRVATIDQIVRELRTRGAGVSLTYPAP